MSQKHIHFAFIASFVVILIGLNFDQKKIGELYHNPQNEIKESPKTPKFEFKPKVELTVDFSTTINVLSDFVESIIHKLVATHTSCYSNSDTAIKAKKTTTECVS